MSQDAGIIKIGLCTFKGMQVRTADTYSPDPDLGMSLFYIRSFFFFKNQSAWFFTNNGLHMIDG
jgi:hypothetical protein